MIETGTITLDMVSDTRAREWLLWARAQRIALTQLQVGDVTLHIAADLALAPSAPSLANPRPEQDPYETYGGEALKRLREQEQQETPPDNEVQEDD